MEDMWHRLLCQMIWNLLIWQYRQQDKMENHLRLYGLQRKMTWYVFTLKPSEWYLQSLGKPLLQMCVQSTLEHKCKCRKYWLAKRTTFHEVVFHTGRGAGWRRNKTAVYSDDIQENSKSSSMQQSSPFCLHKNSWYVKWDEITKISFLVLLDGWTSKNKFAWAKTLQTRFRNQCVWVTLSELVIFASFSHPLSKWLFSQRRLYWCHMLLLSRLDWARLFSVSL